jgi:hypothetical protein
MKRLLILTLVLLPSTIRELGSMAHAAPEPAIVAIAPTPESVGKVVHAVSYPTVESDLMATPERATADADVKLDRAVGDRLALMGIPRTWEPPPLLLRAVVANRIRQEVPKDYAVMHRETLQLDLSPEMLAQFKQAHDDEVAGHRLVLLGEILLFVLAVLAALAGYIHADEATKGYYTNHRRLAAAAGIGAAGVVAYRLLV